MVFLSGEFVSQFVTVNKGLFSECVHVCFVSEKVKTIL